MNPAAPAPSCKSMDERGRVLSIILNEEKTDVLHVEDAASKLRAQGCLVNIYAARGPDVIESLTEQAMSSGADVIVAAGGDGTLNRVVQALDRAEAFDRCAIGVLPSGTANDFATAAEIPLDDPTGALQLAAEGSVTPIDVGRVNDRLFVNAASGGFGAEVTATTPPAMKKTLGGFAYLVKGLIHVPELEGKHARVRAPGLDWDGKMVGFTVGNGRLAGGGFKVAPNAVLDDGLLDLTLFPEVSEGGWTGLVGDLLRTPDDEGYEYLVTCQAPWFEVTVEEELQLNRDGEPFRATELRFDVLENRARFCLPETNVVVG